MRKSNGQKKMKGLSNWLTDTVHIWFLEVTFFSYINLHLIKIKTYLTYIFRLTIFLFSMKKKLLLEVCKLNTS